MSFYDVDDREDEFYQHKIATVLSGSTQDAIEQCSILLCKMLAVPAATSIMDFLTRSGPDSTHRVPEELTLRMEDKGFYKIGRYLIKLSSSVDLSFGLNDDFYDPSGTKNDDKSFGRTPDAIEGYDDDGISLDVVTKGRFEESNRVGSKTFKSNETTESYSAAHGVAASDRFVMVVVPHKIAFNALASFEEAKKTFDRKFERMRSIEYSFVALKCAKMVVPPSVGGFLSDDNDVFCEDEITYMNNPLMLTSTLEHRCGQVCASIYAFDLELLVGIRYEIWRTETDIHNALVAGDRDSPSFRNVTIVDDDATNESDDKFDVVADPVEEERALASLYDKLKKLKTAYAVAVQREKNKLYNLISIECFVKRPWLFVFYLPCRCYSVVRGKKDNNGFDFHCMICEITLRIFKAIDLYDYFLLGTYGERVHVTFLNCGFDISDAYLLDSVSSPSPPSLSSSPRSSFVAESKRSHLKAYVHKRDRFYREAIKSLDLTDVNVETIKKKIVLINNDEISSLSKRVAYLFYTKDRTQRYPVLTKINIKKIVE